MENNKNKKSVKFQGDRLNFCDFIQVFVFTRNHHLKPKTTNQTSSDNTSIINDNIYEFVASLDRETFPCSLHEHNVYLVPRSNATITKL